jgi:hypothetical protein
VVARAKDPTAVRRAARLRRLFSLTPAEYDRIVWTQLGVCGICEKPPRTVPLAVDHDHATGLIRGAICWRCNRLLGVARDSLKLLAAAAEYLRLPPATIALGGERYGRKGRTSNKAATARRLNRPARVVASAR